MEEEEKKFFFTNKQTLSELFLVSHQVCFAGCEGLMGGNITRTRTTWENGKKKKKFPSLPFAIHFGDLKAALTIA